MKFLYTVMSTCDGWDHATDYTWRHLSWYTYSAHKVYVNYNDLRTTSVIFTIQYYLVFKIKNEYVYSAVRAEALPFFYKVLVFKMKAGQTLFI